jgi:hypothetical protein
MDEVVQRFTAWLIRFLAVALLLMIGAHWLGRRQRARRAAKSGSQSSTTPAQKN